MSQKIIVLLCAIYLTSGMSWKQIITLGSVAVAGFLYLIYSQQEKILYLNETIPPKRTSDNPHPFANPKQQGLDYENIWFTTKDNLKLHAWWIPYTSTTNRPAPTLIFYHANAGNMGFRLPNLLQIHNKLKVNIFIVSYRGYGESEGEPNEEGIQIDALAAFDWVHQNKSDEIDVNSIFVFGRSLGGAVAIYTASEIQNRDTDDRKIAGLIIENTFSSIADMVGQVFPFLDFDFVKQFMLKIHWRSIDRIPGITAKMLFLACEKDEIVPHRQMLDLYAAAKSCSTKDMYIIAGGTHNDGWMKGGDIYWEKMYDFIHDTN
eukprot:265557_1